MLSKSFWNECTNSLVLRCGRQSVVVFCDGNLERGKRRSLDSWLAWTLWINLWSFSLHVFEAELCFPFPSPFFFSLRLRIRMMPLGDHFWGLEKKWQPIHVKSHYRACWSFTSVSEHFLIARCGLSGRITERCRHHDQLDIWGLVGKIGL